MIATAAAGELPDLGVWDARAEDLAAWMARRLVNRTDRCGKHYQSPGGGVHRCADPADPADARDGFLDRPRLVRHCRATTCAAVIGGFSYGADGRGMWVLIDIDNHGGAADQDANRSYARHLYDLCADLGLECLLYESDGGGGFHLWVLFTRPVPAAILFAFGRWLVHDHAAHGFAKPPESFPKNPGDTAWGHWVRFPGRHHKRDVWPRVFDGAAWVTGADAVDHVLTLDGSDPALIPTEGAAYGQAVETGSAPPGQPREEGAAAGGWVEPWEDFNRRATLESVAGLLERHGWRRGKTRSDGAVGFMRPGKEARDGEGGNVKVVGGVPLFHCFTNGDDRLAPGKTYAPAALRALLDHGADFRKSNDALRREGYGSRVTIRGGGAAAPPGAGGPPDGPDPSKGVGIILAYFRTRYRPVFRRGNAVRGRDGADVPMAVATAVPDSGLIARLAGASDAPRFPGAGGGVKEAALPGFFKTWARVAWGDLLRSLPDEDDADLGEAEVARDEFRKLVREALLSEVVLGDVIGRSEATQTERRPLIDWCQKFAKLGPWRDIRGKRCWCKYTPGPTEGEVTLQVAIRAELFSQVRADRRLCDMHANTFARRAERYGVGASSRNDRPHGQTAVVLAPGFVADLLAGLPDDPDDPSGGEFG